MVVRSQWLKSLKLCPVYPAPGLAPDKSFSPPESRKVGFTSDIIVRCQSESHYIAVQSAVHFQNLPHNDGYSSFISYVTIKTLKSTCP
jgi:hypothetical protein